MPSLPLILILVFVLSCNTLNKQAKDIEIAFNAARSISSYIERESKEPEITGGGVNNIIPIQTPQRKQELYYSSSRREVSINNATNPSRVKCDLIFGMKMIVIDLSQNIILVKVFTNTGDLTTCKVYDEIILPIHFLKYLSETRPIFIPYDWNKLYSLSSSGNLTRDQTVYYAGGYKNYVNKISYSNPYPDKCYLELRTKMQILGFSQNEQSVWVEVLDERPKHSCTAEDQFILLKSTLSIDEF